MTAPSMTDPRPLLMAAADWTGSRVAGVGPDQLDAPTPCTEYDVRALLGHLNGILIRLEGVGRGERAGDLPSTADIDTDRLAEDYRERLATGLARWQDDAALGRIASTPFGEVPGAVFVSVYAMELLTHGWDLAVATGQDAEADSQVAGPVLAIAQRGVPLEGRGTTLPFGPPVDPSPDAGLTEQLANFLGRSRVAGTTA